MTRPAQVAFDRTFSMPSADTLSIAPIGRWVRERLVGVSVDPFARNCQWATYTNDLNPDTAAQHHMDAEAFCLMLAGRGVRCDTAIFDPPYSPRQISEVYQACGLSVGMKETQNAALYRRVRDALDAIVVAGGRVLSFGWNSNGMGLKRGYVAEEILLVRHGGGHNDTICLSERKSADLFSQVAA